MLIHVILIDAIFDFNYSIYSCALTDSFINRTSSVGAIGSNCKAASKKTGERVCEHIYYYCLSPLSLSLLHTVNVPPNMVQDHYGIIGLLTFIRGAETDLNLVALALGR